MGEMDAELMRAASLRPEPDELSTARLLLYRIARDSPLPAAFNHHHPIAPLGIGAKPGVDHSTGGETIGCCHHSQILLDDGMALESGIEILIDRPRPREQD